MKLKEHLSKFGLTNLRFNLVFLNAQMDFQEPDKNAELLSNLVYGLIVRRPVGVVQ